MYGKMIITLEFDPEDRPAIIEVAGFCYYSAEYVDEIENGAYERGYDAGCDSVYDGMYYDYGDSGSDKF